MWTVRGRAKAGGKARATATLSKSWPISLLSIGTLRSADDPNLAVRPKSSRSGLVIAAWRQSQSDGDLIQELADLPLVDRYVEERGRSELGCTAEVLTLRLGDRGLEVVDGLAALDVEAGVACVTSDLLLAPAGELLGGLLLDVVLVGQSLGYLDAEVVVAEGADVEVRLAIRQHIASAGLLEDIGPEVDQFLGLPIPEELGEGADPGDLVRLLFC